MYHTKAEFIRKIIENPDDDTARLVYADFLDERGEHDRAEFIRLQIERHRLFKSTNTVSLGDVENWSKSEQLKVTSPTAHDHWNKVWALIKREKEILDRYPGLQTWLKNRYTWLVGGQWTGIPDTEQLYDVKWERGFVESIRISSFTFYRYINNIWWSSETGRECPETAHPISSIMINDLPVQEIPTNNFPGLSIRIEGRITDEYAGREVSSGSGGSVLA